MYIPLAFIQDTSSVDVTAVETGLFSAAVSFSIGAEMYDAGSAVEVDLGQIITLYAENTGSFPVTLNSRTYTWKVLQKPEQPRYVDDQAYLRITGTTYGDLLTHTGGVSRSYAESGTVTKAEDLYASIDHANNEVWFFGAGVKKVSVPETPIAVAYTPVEAEEANVSTTAFIVTVSGVYTLTSQLEVDLVSKVDLSAYGEVRDACTIGDSIFVVTDSNQLRVTGSSVQVIQNTGGYAVCKTPTYVYVASDTHIFRKDPANFTSVTVFTAPRAGIFRLASYEEQVFAIDLENKLIVNAESGDYLYTDAIPVALAVGPDSVFVSYLDLSTTYEFNYNLSVKSTISRKAYSLAYNEGLISSILYTDADDVTKEVPYVEVSNTAEVSVPFDQRNEPISCVIPWEQPAQIEIPAGFTALLDGNSFISGKVFSPQVLTITADLPSYNDSYQLDILGSGLLRLYSKVEAKTFPDLEIPAPVIGGYPRKPYYHEYQVSGLTPGYSALLSSPTADILKFSVNGVQGELLEVVNGDTVRVTATLRSYVDQRSDFYLMTATGKQALSWQLLVVQLNGAMLRDSDPTPYPSPQQAVLQEVNAATDSPSASTAQPKEQEVTNAGADFWFHCTAPYSTTVETCALLAAESSKSVSVDGLKSAYTSKTHETYTLNTVDASKVHEAYTLNTVDASKVHEAYTLNTVYVEKDIETLRSNVGKIEIDVGLTTTTGMYSYSTSLDYTGSSTYEFDSGVGTFVASFSESQSAPESQHALSVEFSTGSGIYTPNYHQVETLAVFGDTTFSVVGITAIPGYLGQVRTEFSSAGRRDTLSYGDYVNGSVASGFNVYEIQTSALRSAMSETVFGLIPQATNNFTSEATLTVGEYGSQQHADFSSAVGKSVMRFNILSADVSWQLGSYAFFSTAAKAGRVACAESVIGVDSTSSNVGGFNLEVVQLNQSLNESSLVVDFGHGATAEIGKTAHSAVSSKTTDGAIEFKRLSSPSVVAVPTNVVVFTQSKDSTVEDESGYFATEAEAIAYALDIGLHPEQIEVFQVNGKWIFVSLPYNESLVCSIDTGGGSQIVSTFGYLGGG